MPKINVLENGISVTREMTPAEYAEYMQMLAMAQEESYADI